MQKNSIQYIVGFAAVICLVCSALVSSTAVVLKDLQDDNKKLDKQKKVLSVAGLIAEGSSPTAEEVNEKFALYIDTQIIDMTTNSFTESSGIDAVAYERILR